MMFSVVIPTYNRMDTLRLTLAAVTNQQYPDYEVIVVDDGSSDSTSNTVRREFPFVRMLCQAHAGPAAARNRGLQEARGDVMAFTDDDCLVLPEWLSRLADGLHRHPEAVGVGGPLLAPGPLRQTNILARYEAHVVRVIYGARDREIVAGFDCPAGGTNNMAYRRPALQAIGGFDEGFPYAGGEDADLKWRLAQTGARFLYLPVVTTHLQPYTWPAFRRQQFTRGKGRAYFDRKWGRPPTYPIVALRFIRRLAQLPLRFASPPTLLWPAFEEVWHTTLGQWAAIKELDR